MKCPHCKKDLSDSFVKTAFATLGGNALKKSREPDYYKKLGKLSAKRRWG